MESGLPDIQGDFCAGYSGLTTPSGAFERGPKVSVGGQTVYESSSAYYVKFFASKYNSIYGASETVRPPAIKTAFLIKHD